MKKEKTEATASFLYRFAGEYKGYYILSVILAIIGVLCAVLPFFVMSDMTENLLAGNKEWSVYLNFGLRLAVLWLASVVFKSISTACSHKATFKVLGNMREECANHLARIELGRVKDYQSGTLKNILVERIDSIEPTLAHVVPEFTANLIVPILIFVYIFSISWKMAIAAILPVPLGAIAFVLMLNGYQEDYQNTIVKTKALNDTAVEYINGIEVIKAFGKSKTSYDKFVIAAKEGAACFVDWMRKHIFQHSWAMTIMPYTMLFVLPAGGFFVLKNELSRENFILIILLSIGLLTPLITLASYFDDIAKMNTIVGEVKGILNIHEQEHAKTLKGSIKDYNIALENVRFSYKDTEILHGINLEIKEGTVNALVGPSGSGKSTIAKLIAALWDVKDGRITIGGLDIKEVPLDDYYKIISYVAQDNYLFNLSVKDNIRMGKLTATDEEVINIAKKSGCHDFITGLENGYDTLVGETGGHLSGGERQRITIARAMLADAPVVILDEATAYTDPESEAVIQRSVAKLVENKTLIVIAHRLSTIKDADNIIVVNNGKIEAKGTHEYLFNNCDLYKNMWQAHISVKDSSLEVSA